jgi:hypothetical protein
MATSVLARNMLTSFRADNRLRDPLVTWPNANGIESDDGRVLRYTIAPIGDQPMSHKPVYAPQDDGLIKRSNGALISHLRKHIPTPNPRIPCQEYIKGRATLQAGSGHSPKTDCVE